jgi:hypothetical protein
MKDEETRPSSEQEKSEFLDALKKGVLLGVAILVVALPTIRYVQNERAQEQRAQQQAQVAPRPQVQPKPVPAQPPTAGKLADFAGETPTADVRFVANWAVHSGDFGNKSFVVVDKKDARVWVFDPNGKLKAKTPVLLGAAHGDHTVPGIGDKPLSAVLPEEKTTPAGRFIAEPGFNLNGEDIVWVDYDAAVSMHRVRPLVKAERRLERLASETPEDNRISFGCINMPVAFYEGVLSPTVKATGAVIYVIPETKSIQEVFHAYDAQARQQVAKI